MTSSRLRAFAVAFCFLAAIHSPARAAVVYKIDDSTVTGDLKSIDGDKLIITGKTATVSIPLADISQVTLKDLPSAPVAPVAAPEPVNPPADNGPDLGGGLLGALFGPSHTHHAETPAVAAAPASQPASAAPITLSGQFQLTNGDLLHASLQTWAEQKLRLQMSAGGTLELPSTDLAEIWIGSADLQAKARKLVVDPGPEDVAFVAKDNDVVAVKGLAQGITGNSLQFRFGDQDRKINLGKLVGLLLRSNNPAPMTSFHQLVHTDAGDQISGILTAIDDKTLALATPVGVQIRLPIAGVTTIDFLNGKVSFLTDLKPTRVEQTSYLGRVIPYRVNQSLAGGPLILSDGPCPRGIAVHSRCVLQYDVSSGFDRFKTRLGFEQPDGQLGRVLARVLADGKSMYENPDARGNQPPIDIDVPLTGVHVLTLEIDFGKDQDVGDRVVWANPRLLREK